MKNQNFKKCECYEGVISISDFWYDENYDNVEEWQGHKKFNFDEEDSVDDIWNEIAKEYPIYMYICNCECTHIADTEEHAKAFIKKMVKEQGDCITTDLDGYDLIYFLKDSFEYDEVKELIEVEVFEIDTDEVENFLSTKSQDYIDKCRDAYIEKYCAFGDYFYYDYK